MLGPHRVDLSTPPRRPVGAAVGWGGAPRCSPSVFITVAPPHPAAPASAAAWGPGGPGQGRGPGSARKCITLGRLPHFGVPAMRGDPATGGPSLVPGKGPVDNRLALMHAILQVGITN